MAVQIGFSKVGQYPAHVRPRGTGIGCGRPVAQQSAMILAAGHAFVQNLGCGHYDIATDRTDRQRLRSTFDDLAITI